MAKVFTNISILYQTREHADQIARGNFMAEVPSIEKAYLKVSDGLIDFMVGWMNSLVKLTMNSLT